MALLHFFVPIWWQEPLLKSNYQFLSKSHLSKLQFLSYTDYVTFNFQINLNLIGVSRRRFCPNVVITTVMKSSYHVLSKSQDLILMTPL